LALPQRNNLSFYLLISYHNHHLKRITILTFQYYKLLLFYNVAFTVLIAKIAGPFNPATFLLAKLIGFTAAVALHYYSANKSYFYFRNAGYSIRYIILAAFLIDMSVYFLMIMLFHR